MVDGIRVMNGRCMSFISLQLRSYWGQFITRQPLLAPW